MTCATGEACGEGHAAGKCPWKLVEDVSDFREGMVVQVRPCGWCGRREIRFLGGERNDLLRYFGADPGGGGSAPEPGERIFNQVGACDPRPFGVMSGVRRRAIYRLESPPPDVEATDETQRPATKPRRLTTTNAGGKR